MKKDAQERYWSDLTSYADTNSTIEKRVMEKLDRGTVAVKTNGGVYLS